MDYQVAVSPSARRDLRDIVRYISLNEPARSISFGQFLISKTKILAQFPELGREVPEFVDSRDYCQVVSSYLPRYSCQTSHRGYPILARRTRNSSNRGLTNHQSPLTAVYPPRRDFWSAPPRRGRIRRLRPRGADALRVANFCLLISVSPSGA